MTDQDPSFRLPAHAASSTWDDWIMMRAMPEPPPGKGPQAVAISFADATAVQLRYGLVSMLDLSHQETRDAFRDLFDEFERDTAGQVVTHKDLTAAMHVQMAFRGIDVREADGRVAVTITDGVGTAHELRLEPVQALGLAQRLVEVVGPMAGGESS